MSIFLLFYCYFFLMKIKKFKKKTFFSRLKNTINNYAKFRRRSHKQHAHIYHKYVCAYIYIC